MRAEGLPSVKELKSAHSCIQYFGLGFVQVKLCDVERYHFYEQSLQATVHEESVHNHRYGFRSHILKGLIAHELFEVSDGVGSERFNASCEPDDEALSLEEVAIRKIGEFSLAAGSAYWIDADAYHRVVAAPNTVTRIVRPSIHEKRYAQVVQPEGVERACPFENSFSKDELWELVSSCLEND